MRVPLSSLLAGAPIPASIAEAAEGLSITEFRAGANELCLTVEAEGGAPELGLGGEAGIALVLRELGEICVRWDGPPSVTLTLDRLDVRLPSLLRPASKVAGKWVADMSGRVEVPVTVAAGLVLGWEAVEGIRLWPQDASPAAGIAFSLPASMIGGSGIVVTGEGVRLALDADGVTIAVTRALIHLPDDLPAAPDLAFEDCRVGPNGFSGTVAAEWDLAWDAGARVFQGEAAGQLFAITGGLSRFALTIQDSTVVASDIRGALLIPYFDAPAEVRVTVGTTGDFGVVLLGAEPDGIPLTREELLRLTMRSLAVRSEGGVASVVVSGGLEPLLMAGDGLEWPRLDVAGLSIDTAGRFRIAEAWLDLEKLQPLDLWGFGFDLRRVGLGYEESRDRLWLDLSGGLHLLPQLPLGFDVEGFRLSWPREFASLEELAARVEVQFAGIHLFYGIPEAVEFEGQIRFFRDAQVVGFAGDVALRVPATGLAIEAGLMIGMVLEPPPFPFLYVYLDVELPAGIPLGQSGLALKGALGLFGLNVAPARAPEENWYYDWYKRPRVGAHPTDKWQPERDALALGVGVTITTVDGYVKGVRGLLVLAIPGPILIIEARGLVFDGLGPAEPPLRALAVFDGLARTVQFNLEARAEVVEDVLETWGGLEAFFDFEDLTNWHLYLGQEEPADRRVQANILKLATDRYLFNANAYLMLDMVGSHTLRSRMGFFVGLTQRFDEYDPVVVELEASVGGDGRTTVGPEELSGRVTMDAAIRLSAFGFGVGLSAGADVLTEAPNPFKVDATLAVTADLPDPLEDFDAEFRFTWQSDPAVTVTAPAVGVSATGDLVPGGGALELLPEAPARRQGDDVATTLVTEPPRLSEAAARAAADAAPVVPMDARPTVAFAHDMNDRSDGLFARDSRGDPFFHDIGRIRLAPSLLRIDLYRHRADEPWGDDFAANWRLVASTDASAVAAGADRLWGTWLADAAPDGPTKPGTRRLRLWTANPFVGARGSLGAGFQRLLNLAAPTDGSRQAYADAFLRDYPDYFRCQDTPAETCVDFADARDPTGGGAKTDKETPLRWTYARLAFEATGTVRLRPGGRRPLIQPGAVEPAALAALRSALADLERAFDPLGQPVPASVLVEFASRLPPSVREHFRRERPDLPWHLVPGPACLEVEGDLHVRFPEPVCRVRLRFCQAPGLGATQARSRLTLERPPRAPAEIEEVVRLAREKGEQPDLTRCRIRVDYALVVAASVWTVEAREPFDCLTIRKGARLEEVCHVTAAEAERAGRAKAECERNDQTLDHLGDEPPLLDPGAYYRLLVYTTVDVTRRSATGDGSFASIVQGLLNDLYREAMDRLTGSENEGAFGFLQESFFRVEGPPTSLAPYVAWTHPAPQAIRVFREDDVRVRFRRAGVRRMFERPPHRLDLLVRHADGTVTPCVPAWSKAGGATRFPDEEAWLAHLGVEAPALPADDVLTGKRSAVALAPRARYELLVTGGAGGALLLEDRFVSATRNVWGQPAPAGWTVTPPSDGPDGELRRSIGGGGQVVAGDATWTDVDVTVEARAPADGVIGLVFRHAEDPTTGTPTYIRLVLDRQARQARIEHVGPAGVSAATPHPFATADGVFPPGEWIRLRVVIVGSRIRAWRFDTRLFDLATFAPAPAARGRPRGHSPVRWFDTARLDEAPIRGAIVASGLAPAGPPAGRAGVHATRAGTAFRRFAVRDAVLLRVPFTTAAVGRFADLVGSFQGLEAPVAVPPWPEAAVATAHLASHDYAAAALAWERALVQLRYEEKGRAALEAARLAVRETAAALDDAVMALADAVGIPFFDPPPTGFTVAALRDRTDGALRGFWLRSPESLDLLRGAVGGHVGRTTLGLQRRATPGAGWVPVDVRWLADVAATQVLLLPGTAGLAATFPAGEYRLTLTYRRSLGDESTPGHHRHDRPVESRNGSDSPEDVSIVWTV